MIQRIWVVMVIKFYYDTEDMGSYGYKILIFESINELKSRS